MIKILNTFTADFPDAPQNNLTAEEDESAEILIIMDLQNVSMNNIISISPIMIF
jgi:hypothetical protein